MNISKSLLILIILNCLVFTKSFAQTNIQSENDGIAKSENKNSLKNSFFISFQYIGLTFHPEGGNTPEIYPLKFDKKAYFVLEVGGVVNMDYYFSNTMFIRASVAHYRDCAFVPAGYFHLGFRGTFFHRGKHQINGGIGPTLSYREDWHQFPEYQGDTYYGDRVKGRWQYRFIIYGGEFEYLYQLNDKVQLQFSVIPGIPIIVTSKFGVRIRL